MLSLTLNSTSAGPDSVKTQQHSLPVADLMVTKTNTFSLRAFNKFYPSQLIQYKLKAVSLLKAAQVLCTFLWSESWVSLGVLAPRE